jgi:hypothetical protein
MPGLRVRIRIKLRYWIRIHYIKKLCINGQFKNLQKSFLTRRTEIIVTWSCRVEPVFVNLLRRSEIDSQPGGIDAWESIPGLLERLQIQAQGPFSQFSERKGRVSQFTSVQSLE